MVVNYDIPKIEQCLHDFYNATGINMNLLKDDFSFVSSKSYWENKRYCKAIQGTPDGKNACLCSDRELLEKSREAKKPAMHLCHAGLIDFSIPILYSDNIIGYIIFGQIKADDDFSKLREYVSGLGLDTDEMEKFYNEISVFDEELIKSISNIAEVMVKYILLENMLIPDFDESIQRAVNYINANLESELTIETISKNANVSKSALYRKFESCFNCTVGEFINKKRIEKASNLLIASDLTIEEISARSGFNSSSYFSKAFKKQKGVSPIKFRRNTR